MPIADRIRKARSKLELSQADAARQWGINVRTIQNWEIGRSEPRGFARAQLEKLLAGILGSAQTAQPGRSRKTAPDR